MQSDNQFMESAIALAKKGRGDVRPNPMVGAVIVKDGSMIGEGYHERFGEAHAERNALAHCKESAKGADLYVTLEPCCHYGKTPPCTKAIVEAGIARVFIGSADPNPLVAGKGAQELRDNGIIVTEGVCKEECDKFNEVFFHYIKTKRPFVILKYAMTADGKIATWQGESQWISGEQSRQEVHRSRGSVAAVMVGIGTALKDNPMLNCRTEGGRQPLRIVCDSKLRLPLHSQLVKTAKEFPTLIAAVDIDSEKEKALQYSAVEVLRTPTKDGQADLTFLMDALGARGIDSLLLEGGGVLNFNMLRLGLVSRIQVYIAPKILGGETAKTPVEGLGFGRMCDAILLTKPKVRMIGDDVFLEMDIIKD